MLDIPRGSFTNREESLVLSLNFNSMSRKVFALVAALLHRMSSSAQAVLDVIEALIPESIPGNLKKAKVKHDISLRVASLTSVYRNCFFSTCTARARRRSVAARDVLAVFE